MGLYDTITCKTALPVPKEQQELAGTNWLRHEFHTKDLDPCMGKYEIRADRALWCLNNQTWVKFLYTGRVRFYDHIEKRRKDYWVEFNALFDDGELVKDITLGNWKSEENHERKLAAERLKLFMNDERKRRNRWYWKMLLTPWNRFIRWNIRWIRRCEQWKLRTIDKVEAWLTFN